ncbi:alpha/beta fold hydrolase [Candidatus Woesearchaeota archaeon]|nr:alpha/beta fold hydrolase [Candidatus Woesearchaeota archaeon]
MQKKIFFLNNKNQKLTGILHFPKNIKIAEMPAVIFCHGFRISKDFPLIKEIARAWEKKRGFSVLRFDFTGHGESEGNKKISIQQQEDDIISAVNYLTSQGVKKIGLVGSSFSGFISLMSSIKNKKINSLIIISGVFDFNKTLLTFILKNPSNLFLFLFGTDFFNNFIYYEKFRLKQQLNRLRIPVLLIHSEKDFTVPISNSKKLFNSLKTKKELKVLKDSDHYLNDKKEKKYVIEECYSWFKKYLS